MEQRTAFEAKQTTIDEQAALISLLQEWKRLLNSQRFGSRSERLVPEQGHLFNEAEVEVSASTDDGDDSDSIVVPAHARKKRGRRPLPDFLPVTEILHDLPEEEPKR